MIKIFWGAGVVTPSNPPTNTFCLYPPPVLRYFLKDPLMTPPPTTPLQASFTATPLPIHHPFPPKNFDHTLGLVLLMGHTRLPNYYVYWSTNFLTKQPIFGKTMTRDRFLSILQFFHLCDNNQALPVDYENHDRLLKIRTFMEGIIIPLWQGAYYPGKEVAVDETLVAFKGRTALMQYKPKKQKKPKKWGLNVWTLADQDGYVYNWDLYAGKPKGNQAEQGLTFNVVTKLCRPIYNKGHHVFMDNYFSSPALFDELSRNQPGACAH